MRSSGRIEVAETSRKKRKVHLQEGKKKSRRDQQSFRIVVTHNPAKFLFTTLKNQGAKVRRRKVIMAFAGTSLYYTSTRTQQYQVLTAVTYESVYTRYYLLL